jgi:uncharacterized membrane protein YoaK (UPF0700 family)
MLGFAIGVLVGGRVLRSAPTDQLWPARATVALLVELVITAAFAVGWAVSGGHPDGMLQQALLALIAAAMGVQTAISRRLSRTSSPPTFVTGTPFVTGTLAGLVSQISSGRRLGWLPYAGTLLTLIAGGGVGAFLLSHSTPIAPVAALITLIAAIVTAILTNRKSPVVTDRAANITAAEAALGATRSASVRQESCMRTAPIAPTPSPANRR